MLVIFRLNWFSQLPQSYSFQGRIIHSRGYIYHFISFWFQKQSNRLLKTTKAVRKNIVSGNWFRWLFFLGKKIKEPGAILLNAWLNWIPRNSHLADLNRHYSWATWTLIYWLGARVMWAFKFSRCFCNITYAFKMNLHSAIDWMSRNSLLESSGLSEN